MEYIFFGLLIGLGIYLAPVILAFAVGIIGVVIIGLIEDIEIKISGRKYTNEQVLRDIEDSQADYSDIK